MSDGDLAVTLSIDDQQEDLAVDLDRLEDTARRVALAEGANGEISILLVDEDRIAELNEQYMGGDGPTDVLAFPIDGLVTKAPRSGAPVVIGEIVLCPAVAAAQAPEGPGGLVSELDLLITHGTLHLLGYDHDTEEAAAAMRAREEAGCGRSGASAS